jgi:hypothetical protein
MIATASGAVNRPRIHLDPLRPAEIQPGAGRVSVLAAWRTFRRGVQVGSDRRREFPAGVLRRLSSDSSAKTTAEPRII